MPHGEQIDDSERRAARAASFGAAAAEYERARPGYPAEAVRAAVGDAPLDVLDLGAGTGKLTRTLVELGHRVQAVDPSAQMLATLGEALPGVVHRVGSAEAIPLPDNSVDAVLAGQAFHWFDLDRALPELARVLRPDGILGLLWNIRDDRTAWVARFGELVGAEDAGDSLEPPELGRWFGAATMTLFQHDQLLTVEGLVELAASRSSVILLPEPERTERLEAVRALGRETAVGGEIRLPYQLQLWRAIRA